MKTNFLSNILCVIFLISPGFLSAQQELVSVEGLDFGLDKKIIKMLLNNKGVEFSESHATYAISDMALKGFFFGTEEACTGMLLFDKDKFRVCSLTFMPTTERVDTILKLYNYIKSVITNKYGNPTSVIEGRIETDSIYNRYKIKLGNEYAKTIGDFPSYNKFRYEWGNLRYRTFPAFITLDIERSRNIGRSVIRLLIGY